VCKAHRWSTLSLTGDLDARKRQALVDEFNAPAHPSFVLLLSSKAGGTGLNIVGANRLVLLDPRWGGCRGCRQRQGVAPAVAEGVRCCLSVSQHGKGRELLLTFTQMH
jgi:hypothetical protein